MAIKEVKRSHQGFKVIRDVDGDRYLLKLKVPKGSVYHESQRSLFKNKHRSNKSIPIECWLIDGLSLIYCPDVTELHHVVFFKKDISPFIYKIGQLTKTNNRFNRANVDCGSGIHYFRSALTALREYSGNHEWKYITKIDLNRKPYVKKKYSKDK